MSITLPYRKLKSLPTQAELRDWLDYDPETGIFLWKKNRHVGHRMAGRVAGGYNNSGYRQIRFAEYGKLAAHRLAWIYVYGDGLENIEVDHIDGNRGNNAIANLRLATTGQQSQNRGIPTNNTSGYKGVSYVAHPSSRSKPWRASIGIDKKRIHLGHFRTAEEARDAYVEAAQKLFGQFVRAA